MDHLQSIIHSLSEKDHKEFKIFLNRARKKTSRKDLDLFILLQENKEFERIELLNALYPDDHNLEAYHATRKRLIKQLNEFIYLQRIKQDSTRTAQISSNLSLCEYLFEKKQEQTAWHYLKNTEELAIKGENYGLLNEIYRLGIQHSLSSFSIPIDELVEKKKNVQELLIHQENAQTANFLIRNQLNEALTKGEDIDIERLVQTTLKDYNLTQVVETNPTLMLNIIEIARTVVLAKKDFYSFEPYIINQFYEMEERKLFTAFNHEIKVKVLYMITHVLYRNRKWNQALSFAQLLYESMMAYNQKCERQFFQKYHLLLGGIYTYSGQLDKAIELLEDSLKNKYSSLDTIQYLNTKLNLCIFYFYKKDYQKTISIFLKMEHSDTWYTKNMGQESLLKKQLLEIMNHYELANTDYVEARVKSVKRVHENLFHRPPYNRAKSFLTLLNRLNNNPFLATTPEFSKLVSNSFDFVPKEMEDLQAMTFYAWLKAKMLNKNYYDIVVEMVNS